MANSVDSDETLRAVSSRSTLFAKVSDLACRTERVNITVGLTIEKKKMHGNNYMSYFQA